MVIAWRKEMKDGYSFTICELGGRWKDYSSMVPEVDRGCVLYPLSCLPVGCVSVLSYVLKSCT